MRETSSRHHTSQLPYPIIFKYYDDLFALEQSQKSNSMFSLMKYLGKVSPKQGRQELKNEGRVQLFAELLRAGLDTARGKKKLHSV